MASLFALDHASTPQDPQGRRNSAEKGQRRAEPDLKGAQKVRSLDTLFLDPFWGFLVGFAMLFRTQTL